MNGVAPTGSLVSSRLPPLTDCCRPAVHRARALSPSVSFAPLIFSILRDAFEFVFENNNEFHQCVFLFDIALTPRRGCWSFDNRAFNAGGWFVDLKVVKGSFIIVIGLIILIIIKCSELPICFTGSPRNVGCETFQIRAFADVSILSLSTRRSLRFFKNNLF